MEELREAYIFFSDFWKIIKKYWDYKCDSDEAWDQFITFGNSKIETLSNKSIKVRRFAIYLWDGYLKFKEWEMNNNYDQT